MKETAVNRDAPRYGDYPELFCDLRADMPVDVNHPSILARILREARLDVILELVPMDHLRRELPNLFVPDYTRRLWTRVLEILDERRQDVSDSVKPSR